MTHYISTYHTTTEDYREHTQSAFGRGTPSADDKDPERHLLGSSDNTQKYVKHLDKKVQVDTSASLEPEKVPDPESTEDTWCTLIKVPHPKREGGLVLL